MKPLPGASSTNYVHTNAAWTPDGKHLIFSRAPAKDKHDQEAESRFAGDERETAIQYNLCRIPFNEGKGGVAVPLKGASNNGKSNSFPKISPDGKWVVFVKCRRGQLMRPDSKLYIMPIEGGEVREMSCNLNPMNSWHSWSPNGKWLVFSSKGFRPFTQMFLTHIDDQGMDTPAILIPNSTADNRAVNIPEFLNGPGDSIVKISAPTQLAYKHFNEGVDLMAEGDLAEALIKVEQSISIYPHYSEAHAKKGLILYEQGRYAEALASCDQSISIYPYEGKFHFNKGLVFDKQGRYAEALASFEKALEFRPDDEKAHFNKGLMLYKQGHYTEALASFDQSISINPYDGEFHCNKGAALLSQERYAEAGRRS